MKKLSNTTGQNLQLMKQMPRHQKVPQAEIDEVMQVHNLDDDGSPSQPLYPGPNGTQRTVLDKEMSTPDGTNGLLLGDLGSMPMHKRKWLDDSEQPAAANQSLAVLQDVVVAVKPMLFETVAQYRHRGDVRHNLVEPNHGAWHLCWVTTRRRQETQLHTNILW
jgi:hypothetical protein